MMCPYLARQLSGFSTANSKFVSDRVPDSDG
jgi:hypothetical protein